jgi:hypothetical protein
MPLVSASADTFIIGATISLVAFFYQRSTPAAPMGVRQPNYRSFVTGILAVHTLYMLYIFSFKAPPNLFTRLHLPLSMPSQKIRAVLLTRMEGAEDDPLPEHIEELLTKLNTFDFRTYLVRSVPAPRDSPSPHPVSQVRPGHNSRVRVVHELYRIWGIHAR